MYSQELGSKLLLQNFSPYQQIIIDERRSFSYVYIKPVYQDSVLFQSQDRSLEYHQDFGVFC